MRSIIKLIESIYLGDRYCERVEFKDNKIMFQINRISRIKEGTKEWNYYSDEDIEHGYLVFDEVIDYSLSSELSFNDEIYQIIVEAKEDEVYSFIVYGCNVSDEAISTDIEMYIRAKKFYIFNPMENKMIL